MTSVERIFEDHISVRDLRALDWILSRCIGHGSRSLQSRSVEGMGGGLLWVGGRGRSMLGIYSLGSTWTLTIMQHHVAFEVKIEDLLAAPQRLRAAGVAAMGGRHEPIDEPVVFSWMPAASVFLMTLTAICWNTLRCLTTDRNQSSGYCCRGVNGSRAGRKSKSRERLDSVRAGNQMPRSQLLG